MKYIRTEAWSIDGGDEKTRQRYADNWSSVFGCAKCKKPRKEHPTEECEAFKEPERT